MAGNAEQIKKVAVVGAGTMGPGIAAVFAAHGYATTLIDVREDVLERARKTTEIVYNVLTGAGMMAQEQAAAGRANLTFTLEGEKALPGADFVLETIPEDADLKRQFFSQVETLVGPDVVLASNTSGIPISKIAEVCQHPGRVIGTHWSNPPHIIPVIEIIRGEQTTDETFQTAWDLSETIGMIPAEVLRDVPGFVENRVLYAIMREALYLVEAGIATPEAVDKIVKWGIGYKLAVIPPLELLDVAGLDIYHSVASYLNAELNNDSGVSSAITERVARGDLGIKTGRGLFDYEPDEIPALMQKRMKLLLATKKALMDGA